MIYSAIRDMLEINRYVPLLIMRMEVTIQMDKTNGLSIFISYSHKDGKYRSKLEAHLSPLKREGLISEWHDRKIAAGTEWKGQIDNNLNNARIILLLISADFINSDYCMDTELKCAMEKHEKGAARVIPVILRPCDWHTAIFGKLQAIPTDGKPITSWKPHDSGFYDAVKQLRKTVHELLDSKSQFNSRPNPHLNLELMEKNSITDIISSRSKGNDRFVDLFDDQIAVCLKAGGYMTAHHPFGTGEPLHLRIHLTIRNMGNNPVFIVNANLKDPTGSRMLTFRDVCDETNPLQPGQLKRGELKLLYHDIYPPNAVASNKYTLVSNNLAAYKLLRQICLEGSYFALETGKGALIKFNATDVCDEDYLNWHSLATPQEILDEFGGLNSNDMETGIINKLQKLGPSFMNQEVYLDRFQEIIIQVKSFYYQDVSKISDSIQVVTSCPRRYRSALLLTNHSASYVFIVSISVFVETKSYTIDYDDEPIKIESRQSRTLDLSFPTDEKSPVSSGSFTLEIFTSTGGRISSTGTFPA